MNFIYLFANGIIDKPTGIPSSPEATPEKLASLIIYAGSVAAVISVIIIVIAGIQFILSSGEPGKVAKARNAILYAVVGLVVSLSATAIASFVARGIG
jgi:hypothetical protein